MPSQPVKAKSWYRTINSGFSRRLVPEIYTMARATLSNCAVHFAYDMSFDGSSSHLTDWVLKVTLFGV